MAEKITIDRSLDQVWAVFTDVSSWKTWWGGDLKSVTPGWQGNAKMRWSNGDQTAVLECHEKRRVELEGRYNERAIWSFQSASEGCTSVTLSSTPTMTSIGLSNDANVANLAYVTSDDIKTLQQQKLFQLKRFAETQSSTAGPLATKKWWRFWS